MSGSEPRSVRAEFAASSACAAAANARAAGAGSLRACEMWLATLRWGHPASASPPATACAVSCPRRPARVCPFYLQPALPLSLPSVQAPSPAPVSHSRSSAHPAAPSTRAAMQQAAFSRPPGALERRQSSVRGPALTRMPPLAWQVTPRRRPSCCAPAAERCWSTPRRGGGEGARGRAGGAGHRRRRRTRA